MIFSIYNMDIKVNKLIHRKAIANICVCMLRVCVCVCTGSHDCEFTWKDTYIYDFIFETLFLHILSNETIRNIQCNLHLHFNSKLGKSYGKKHLKL